MRESTEQQDVLALDVMAVKRCSICGIEKPVAEFGRGRPGYCRPCWAKRAKEYRATLSVERRQRDLDAMAAWGLNIKRQQIEEQRAKQGGLCAICSKPLVVGRGVSGQNVDHDHDTFKPRGLLCKECNRRVGWYESWLRLDPKLQAKLLAYLESPPWESVGEVDVELIRQRMRHRTHKNRSGKVRKDD